MELIESKVERKQTNCNGPEEDFTVETFLVQPADVGTRLDHYMGHMHKTYKFGKNDAGRKIQRFSQPTGYMVWFFA